jgi:hypothetical protein
MNFAKRLGEAARDAFFQATDVKPGRLLVKETTRGKADVADYQAAVLGAYDMAVRDSGLLLSQAHREAVLGSYAYTHNTTVRGLIQIGYEGLVNAPFKVLRQNPVTLETSPASTSALYKMLQAGGMKMSTSELISDHYMWYQLIGTAYLAADRATGRLASRTPLSLYSLNPMFVWPILDENTGVEAIMYLPQKAGSPPTEKDILEGASVFPISSVAVTRTPNPKSTFVGTGPLEALRDDYDILGMTARAIRSRMKHTTKIQAWVKTDDATDQNTHALFESRMRQYAANERFSGVLLMEPGMEYNPVQSPQMDHLVQQVLTSSLRNFALTLRVPLSLFDTSMNVSEREVLERAMWTYNLIPFTKRLAESLCRTFCMSDTARDVVVMPDYSQVPVLQTMFLDQMRVNVAGVNSGITTPNEARARLGYPAYTGEGSDFGDRPLPVFQAEMAEKQAAAKASDSLSLIGSGGGRDQSESGESQMLDETGRK